MHTDSVQPPTVAGYASTSVTKAPNWHVLVALDVMFNNMTTGLFLVAALGELMAPASFGAVAKVAYPVAWLFLFGDLAFLVADLGDPLRFHHMLRVFKPSSPMSLGTWCLTVYALTLSVLVAVDLLPGSGNGLEWAHRLALITGLLPAFGAAGYKGVLFSTSSQPAWKDARWLGGYLFNSALLLGCAELLTLSVLMDRGNVATMLRSSMVLMILFNLVLLRLLLADIRTALSRAYPRSELGRLGALVLGGGVLLPLCLLVVGSAFWMLVAVLFVILAALLIRFEIVRLPHILGVPGKGNIQA